MTLDAIIPPRIAACSATAVITPPVKPISTPGCGSCAHTEITAFRNATLQGGYYLLALRAVGLDCGAMSGFDNAKADAAFFPDGRFKSNFLVNIGYGTGKGIVPRNPRLSFEETCRFV